MILIILLVILEMYNIIKLVILTESYAHASEDPCVQLKMNENYRPNKGFQLMSERFY